MHLKFKLHKAVDFTAVQPVNESSATRGLVGGRGRTRTAFEISVDRGVYVLYLLQVIDEMFPFVGEFRELGHGRPDGPSLRSAVRAQESANARELVEYLRAGTVLAATTTLVHDVLSPDYAVIGGLHLLTDGHWLWYSDLAHYVERHHVALDPQFIAHARSNDWTAPLLSEADLLAVEAKLLGDAAN
ncbi:hypothetical protein ACFQ6N_00675 [Kitasatospora sp. NPDC056446]|uniref:hypothetical protein n=1 Tax=Kitasatospora sp. NPDC056446 TaxID=3345819 RepID=UPI00369BD286